MTYQPHQSEDVTLKTGSPVKGGTEIAWLRMLAHMADERSREPWDAWHCAARLVTEIIEGEEARITGRAILSRTPAPSEPPDLHQQIMNLPCKHGDWSGENGNMAYKLGHRDARHAAAELVASAVAAPSGVPAELLNQAQLLCEWIAESPHQRGSINGAAAQLHYAISSRPTAPSGGVPADMVPADAILIDWPRETKDPVAEMDRIYTEYATTFGRYPDAEMSRTVRKVKEMLFDWWAWHREAIHAALTAAAGAPTKPRFDDDWAPNPNDDQGQELPVHEAAPAKHEPVAWARTQFIYNREGFPIGTDDPEVEWGRERPESDGEGDDWMPLFAHPAAPSGDMVHTEHGRHWDRTCPACNPTLDYSAAPQSVGAHSGSAPANAPSGEGSAA